MQMSVNRSFLRWCRPCFMLVVCAIFNGFLPNVAIGGKEPSSTTVTQIVLIPPDAELREFAGDLWRIVIDGPIDQNTGAELRRVLKEADVTRGLVNLNSPGGSIVGAIDMGNAIHERSLDTSVARWVDQAIAPGRCISACVYSYLGGRFRILDKDAVLGIHRFVSTEKNPQDLEFGQAVSGLLLGYLREMGVSSEVYERISRVPASTYETLTIDEALKLGVANNGKLPPSWSIETTDMAIYLKGEQETIYGLGKAIFTCSPNGMLFSPYYFVGTNSQKVAQSARSHSLTIDGEFIEIGQADSRLLVMGNYIMGNFLLPDTLLARISGAASVGYAIHTGERGLYYGFNVDVYGNTTLLSRFFSQCTVSALPPETREQRKRPRRS